MGEDVTFTKKGKAIIKKIIKESKGGRTDMPCAGSKVRLSVMSSTDGINVFPDFQPRVFEFTVGNGEFCDALECAVSRMKKGEMAGLSVFTATALTPTFSSAVNSDFRGAVLSLGLSTAKPRM